MRCVLCCNRMSGLFDWPATRTAHDVYVTQHTNAHTSAGRRPSGSRRARATRAPSRSALWRATLSDWVSCTPATQTACACACEHSAPKCLDPQVSARAVAGRQRPSSCKHRPPTAYATGDRHLGNMLLGKSSVLWQLPSSTQHTHTYSDTCIMSYTPHIARRPPPGQHAAGQEQRGRAAN